jgi:hypothetical protein
MIPGVMNRESGEPLTSEYFRAVTGKGNPYHSGRRISEYIDKTVYSLQT